MNTNWKDELALFLKAMPVAVKKSLCNDLAGLGVELLSDTQGMVMMTAVDGFDTSFHLGEILVRQVKVQLENGYGIGITMNDSTEDAFIMAASDAAESVKNAEIEQRISEIIQKNAHFRKEMEAIDRGIAKATKVNFGLMVEG